VGIASNPQACLHPRDVAGHLHSSNSLISGMPGLCAVEIEYATSYLFAGCTASDYSGQDR